MVKTVLIPVPSRLALRILPLRSTRFLRPVDFATVGDNAANGTGSRHKRAFGPAAVGKSEGAAAFGPVDVTAERCDVPWRR